MMRSHASCGISIIPGQSFGVADVHARDKISWISPSNSSSIGCSTHSAQLRKLLGLADSAMVVVISGLAIAIGVLVGARSTPRRAK